MKDKPRSDVIRILAGIVAFTTSLIIIIVTLTTFGAPSGSLGPIKFASPTAIPSPTTPIPLGIPAQVATLQDEVAALRQELDVLTQMTASIPNPDVVTLRTDLDSLDERFSAIEGAILDNPARVLQFTLLSRDMDDLKETYESDLESTRQEIGRMYDLNKWFVGLMFTMAIGLLGLAVGNFIKKPERAEVSREQQKPEEK